MQVSVEAGEGLEKRMSVELPAEKVNAAVDKKLNELSRNIRMDGFRPGKVPMRVIKQKFGGQVRQEAYGDLIQSTYFDAISDQGLKPAGEPKIEVNDDSGNDGFTYTATFEVMPEIELADLSEVEITRTTAEVEDSDIDEMIESLRKQRTEWNEVERAAENGDTVTIDFVGTKEGEAFEGGTANDVPLELGSGAMIDGFESGLVGAKAGETRNLDVKFPDDYRAKHLAGQEVSFEVTVKKVAEGSLPEITEEFIQQFGVEDGSVESWRAEIRTNMERELKKKLTSALKDDVMDALLKANELSVPSAMVTEEAGRMKQQALAEMQQSGQSTGVDLPVSLFEEQAKRRVELGLLVGEIIREQELQVNQDGVTEMIQEISETYEDPQQVVDFYAQDKDQRAAIENLVLENQVVDWVVSQVKVTDEASSFSEVMDNKPTEA